MRLTRKKLKGLARPLTTVFLTASVVLSLLESAAMSAELAVEVGGAWTAMEDCLALLNEPEQGGRGLSLLPRLPTLKRPKANIYDELVHTPDRFKDLCGWSPEEFRDLLADVRDVLTASASGLSSLVASMPPHSCCPRLSRRCRLSLAPSSAVSLINCAVSHSCCPRLSCRRRTRYPRKLPGAHARSW